ncbi:MAG TPA: hypothetical protein VMW54_15360 [Terriglobia bacterium]|nr:hypothetical protein [Terriglobia bacterium]
MEPSPADRDELENLAGYRRCVDRIYAAWPGFLERRAERLAPHPLLGNTPEKITESILEDLCTHVLDWPLAGFNPQVDRADIVLSNSGIRDLIIEAKRPGSLAWNRRAVERAMDQAIGYAAKQHVLRVAVSDGFMLYAADIVDGGIHDRVFVSLADASPSPDLWWLSVQGIYRSRGLSQGAALRLLPEEPVETSGVVPQTPAGQEPLLHPKYKLPARCFAYVGDHADPRSWKLPYLAADGTIDAKRLPKAIQSILTNYRGVRVRGIPDVLSRLARAAAHAGHLSPAASNPAAVYSRLVEALKQFGITPEPE